MLRVIVIALLIGLGGCASKPPSNIDSICKIFTEKRGWYMDARVAGALTFPS